MYLKSVSAFSQNLESLSFVDRDKTQITTWELVFIIFGSAFALGEYTSSSEHGWISESCFIPRHPALNTTLQFTSRTYVHHRPEMLSSYQLIHPQIWNVFDFSFVVVFVGYLTLRIKGLGHNDRKTSCYLYHSLN